MNTRSRLLMLLLIIFCSTASCSKLLYVKPEGNLFREITFSFYEHSKRMKPIKVNILALYVIEQVNGKKWRTVWELSGSAKLDKIVYGGSYNGLIEKHKPEILKIGGHYEVSVSLDPGGGEAAFTFMNNGDLLQVPVEPRF